MNKTTWIIGHRNPDTDSVVAAAAYAQLKAAMGLEGYRAARAGKINPQTEYIFERFGVPVPEYLGDLIPKVGFYLGEVPPIVDEDCPLWEALETMEKNGLKVLPIVRKDGTYRSLLHYNAFAQNILKKVNPRKKASILTSIDLLRKTLQAQAVEAFDEEELSRSPIVVAASADESFKKHLDSEMPQNALVIVGDRYDIQKYCIEKGVRALIITNGNTLDRDLLAQAREKRVSVLISPFDTSSTALLIIYSTPVFAMGDETVQAVSHNEPVRRIRAPLSQSASRCLPVLDAEGRVAGVISEGDLIKEPNLEVIMVDHNEPTQAIEGIEHYKIQEVIDHHRLGNLSTRYPITFINRVVGATSTIITNLYREQRIPIEKGIAAILLCGILADTLVLQSATTTDVDHEAADYLSSITGLDVELLGRELKEAASLINSRPARELVRMDMKEYDEKGARFSVSQIETETPEDLVARKDEILAELADARREGGRLFSALMVTDVTELNSLLFVAGDKNLIRGIRFPAFDKNVWVLGDIVSRKKQLMPLLSELIERVRED